MGILLRQKREQNCNYADEIAVTEKDG